MNYPNTSLSPFHIKDECYMFLDDKIPITYIGESLIKLSEMTIEEVSKIIYDYPNKTKECSRHNFNELYPWLYTELSKKYDIVSVKIFISHFKSIVQDYLRSSEKIMNEMLHTIKESTKDISFEEKIDSNVGEFYKKYLLFVLPLFTKINMILSDIQVKIKTEDLISKYHELLNNPRINYNIRYMNGQFYSLYKIDKLDSFAAFEIYQILEKNVLVKKCECCEKYFIPVNRSDTIYCDRPSPNDNSLSCKKYGSQKLWYEKLKKDEAGKLYRNIYMRKQMAAKRNPDIDLYREDFDKYKVESKQWQADVSAGVKTEDNYLIWLKFKNGKN